MRLALRLGLAALAAAALAGAASAAGNIKVVEAGGSTYPDRSYILTLPSPKSLTRSDVTVTENGQGVANLRVAHQGTTDSGSAVVLAIDASASMAGKPIQDAVAASRAFATRMNPEQQVAVVTFNNGVNVVQGFTTDKNKVLSALDSIPKLAVGTKIYDGLDQSLQLIGKTGVPTGTIVLLSDGTDVGSKAKASSVLANLKLQHVRVFSVGLASRTFDRKALQKVADSSGGSFVVASGPEQLTPIFEKLGRQLASEYLLSYTSRQNPHTNVLVKVAVAGFPGAARTAYTTPALKIVPAAPYKPSTTDQVIQSRWTMVLIALAFAVLIGFAISHAAASREDPLVTRVGSFVAVEQPANETKAEKRQRQSARSILTRMSANASRATWWGRIESSLELADIEMDPLQLVVLTTICTLLAMLVFGMAIGIIGVLAALSVPFIVRQIIRTRISRKRRAFAEQLPDNLDVLASALRAGHSLVGALTVVADDATEPSKAEFQRVLAEEQFGVNLEDALQIAVTRMQNTDLDQVALVARLQREVGSNSAEVLDKVIETLRARMELRRLIRTLTAQGRLSRWILTLLPIGLALMMTIVGGSYMHPLFHETLGRVLLVVAGIMVATGSYIIGKIVDIKILIRW